VGVWVDLGEADGDAMGMRKGIGCTFSRTASGGAAISIVVVRRLIV
jgi:hypothetical protein